MARSSASNVRRRGPASNLLRDPGQASAPTQGPRVPKGTRTGLATPVVLKVWAAPMGVSEVLVGVYKIKTVFGTTLRRYF